MSGSHDTRLLVSFDYASLGVKVESRIRDDNNDPKTVVEQLISAANAQNDEISLAESNFMTELQARARR